MLTLSNEAISKAIRAKKKKMAESEPEMVGTSPGPDLNAQDVYDIQQAGRIESTLMSPKKINANETMLNESSDSIGLTPEEKMRMARLRTYMDGLELDA